MSIMSQTCRLIQELHSRPSKKSEEEETGWGRKRGVRKPKGAREAEREPKTTQKEWVPTALNGCACQGMVPAHSVSDGFHTRLQYLTLAARPGPRRVCGGLVMALSDLRGEGRLLHELGAQSMADRLFRVALGFGPYQRSLARRWSVGA
jgi:hypothetical protein